MLAAERRPAPITIRPATTKIAKNGGPGRCSASGMGSGRACASTVLPVIVDSFDPASSRTTGLAYP